MTVEVTTFIMTRFMDLLETVETSDHDQIMVMASSDEADALLIGRGGKNKPWKVSMVETTEIKGWKTE